MSVFIIAEAGVNHNGDVALAKKLIAVAAMAKADAVKFQTFKAENIVTAVAEKATYQIQNTGNDETQSQMLKRLELSYDVHEELQQYAIERGLIFMSTPFDLDSIDLLSRLHLEIWKIPSGEITNLPYLRRIGALNKRLIMSTGMSTLDEVSAAIAVLIESGTAKDKLTVLHCHTDYPTQMADVNLRAMLTMRNELAVKVGYSDHTLGIEVPIAAVALGATVIEKHFTLDRNLPGPDHRASLEPEELKAMVRSIRNVEQVLGSAIKQPTKQEKEIMKVARKSLVAARDIAVGELFTKENITVKRPGTGLSPMLWFKVIGRIAKKDFQLDDFIEI